MSGKSLTWEEIKPDARGLGYLVLAAPPMPTTTLIAILPDDAHTILIEDYRPCAGSDWLDAEVPVGPDARLHCPVRNVVFDIALTRHELAAIAHQLAGEELRMFVLRGAPAADFRPSELRDRGALRPRVWEQAGLVLGIERADSASPVLFTSVDRETLEAVRRAATSHHGAQS